MIFTIADLSFDRQLLQQKILHEHISDICVYLSNRINILPIHLTYFPALCPGKNCPPKASAGCLSKFCQNSVDERGGRVLPVFFGKLHRLIDCHSGRNLLII